VSTQEFALIAGDIAVAINSVQGLAHLGFTGGTGALSATQEILQWDVSIPVAAAGGAGGQAAAQARLPQPS
jgi:hypothetical protein